MSTKHSDALNKLCNGGTRSDATSDMPALPPDEPDNMECGKKTSEISMWQYLLMITLLFIFGLFFLKKCSIV